MATYRFGSFEVRAVERQLLADGRRADIGSRAFDVLVALIERRDRMVTKAELLDVAWPGLVVEENNLAAQVSALRKVLGPHALATVPGRGYRFAMSLDESPESPKPTVQAPFASVTRRDAEPLVGRHAAVEAVTRLLSMARLVTIVGVGGMGKTRLAREVVLETPVCWVDLAAVTSGARIAAAIAAASGVRLPEGEPVGLLVGQLESRNLLLVLDNCEHLVAEVAAVARAVLDGAPNVRILATSRAVLRLMGEHVYRLEGLDIPARGSSLEAARSTGSIQLLEQRARAADGRFALDASNVADAVELCARLDGVPLALEMAAARLPVLGVRALKEGLERRFDLLSSARRDVPDRHKSLLATLEWSHALLDAPQRKVLRQLSSFAGAFDLDAACKVIGAGGLDDLGAIDALTALVDRSLVQVESLEPPRYRLLDAMRFFAGEEVARHGEREEVRGLHSRAMAKTAEQIERSFWEMDAPDWLASHMHAYADLQEAFDWACRQGDAEDAGAMGAVLSRLDFERDTEVEIRERKMQAHSLLRDASPTARARILSCLSTFRFIVLDQVRAIDVARQRVTAWRELGNITQQFEAMGELSKHLAASGEFAQALRVLEETEGLVQAGWPRRLLYRHWVSAAQVGMYCSNEAVVRSSCSRMGECTESGVMTGEYRRYTLARLALVTGKPDAIPLLRASVEELRALNRVRLLGYAVATLSAAHVRAGDLAAARQAGEEALDRSFKFEQYCQGMDHIALLASAIGQHEQAARLLGFADAMYAESQVGRPWPELWSEAHAVEAIARRLGPANLSRLRAAGARHTRKEANDLAHGALRADAAASM